MSHVPQLFRPEVLEFLEKSLCTDQARQKYGDSECAVKYKRLLLSLSLPPAFTTVRLNSLVSDKYSICQQLQQLVTQNYNEKGKQCPQVTFHPLLDDCCLLENIGPCQVTPAENEVLVDVSCGTAVLRGADIFVQGILSVPAGMAAGDKVSVYVDVDGKCRKGLTKSFIGNKLFVGNGLAMVSRQQIFSNGGTVSSGVGIKMTDPLYVAPSLSDLVPHLIFPQNLPSLLCVHVLQPQPGETVLDMCAAPGGKTTHIAAMMRNMGRVVALDKSRNKLQKLRENVMKWNLNGVEVYGFDATNALDPTSDCLGPPPYPPGCFDRILLDAPCSGLGQRPVVRNNAKLTEVTSYPPLQRRLFEKAVSLLKSGGTLLYTTCTITLEENECIVAWALNTFANLQLAVQEPCLAGHGWPGSSLTDHQLSLVQRFDPNVETVSTDRAYDSDTIGFFIAKFIKINC